MQIVEPDRGARARFCGDHIGCRIADAKVCNFEVRCLKPVAALIELDRIEFGQQRDQARDRVIGQVRIGDMPLRAGCREPQVHRPAPADLGHIAQPVRRSRLTHQAQVGQLPGRAQMSDDLDRTELRGAFFIAGNQETDRAGSGGDRRGGRNHGRDRTLHIDRAAPEQQVAAAFGRKRRAGPPLARRHDVEMPGKGEMAAARRPLTHRNQVFDRAIGRLTGYKAMHRKAQRRQLRLHFGKHRARRRGHAVAGHQPFGQNHGIGHATSNFSIVHGSAAASLRQAAIHGCSLIAST